ncbi:hypothetical protein FOA52_004186 [Chlamydomonas sp. UWO 241]|nr:hypothetical protein FOA52_004186 [Chlamydomonas sp. UWO 241]
MATPPPPILAAGEADQDGSVLLRLLDLFKQQQELDDGTLLPFAALQLADVEADEAERAAAVAQVVLFELWPELHLWLDRGSKRALRGVSRAMCARVEGSIGAVTSPEAGISVGDLLHALATMARMPRLRDLTLLNVDNPASTLTPLGSFMVSLAGVTSLTIRESKTVTGLPPRGTTPSGLHGTNVGSTGTWNQLHEGGAWYRSMTPADVLRMEMAAGAARRMEIAAWGLPTLSSGLAATLQVVDVSDCAKLTSIYAVRSCVQLRCLRMVGVGVSDLSPLGACSQLEELSLGSNILVTSLAPLKACPRLRVLDLDLYSFQSVLRGQALDLQLTCTQLALPPSIIASLDMTTLVQQLGSCSEGAQFAAANRLCILATLRAENKAAILAAGGYPVLMQLLSGLKSSSRVQEAAALALRALGIFVL